MRITRFEYHHGSDQLVVTLDRVGSSEQALAALRALSGHAGDAPGEAEEAPVPPPVPVLAPPREPGDEDPFEFPPKPRPALGADEDEPAWMRGEPEPKGTPNGLPADLAPFRGMGSLKEVLVRLSEGAAAWGVEDYVRACLDLRDKGVCPLLDRVPNLVERIVRALLLLKLASFDPPDQADAATDTLVRQYGARLSVA